MWKTVVGPDVPLHDAHSSASRVIIALSGDAMKVVYEDGASEMHDW